MKSAFQLLSALILICFAVSCGGATDSVEQPLDKAEQAYQEGMYGKAQTLADSLVTEGSLRRLSPTSLCRLSLLLVRLGEVSGEIEPNTALAARALEAAVKSDRDSTVVFIEGLPVDDRARLLLVEAVSEGSRHVFDADSAEAAIDSLINID